MENNLNVLNSIDKGCSMAIDSLNAIIERCNSIELKEVTMELRRIYKDISSRCKKLYKDYTGEELDTNNSFDKIVTWYNINVRTIMNDSESKLSEIIILGLVSGIIDGIRSKSLDIDKKVMHILKEYISIQEDYIDKYKKYI